MKTVYTRIMIAPPDAPAYSRAFHGATIENCIEQLQEYLETTPPGTKSIVEFAGYQNEIGEADEVA